MYWYEMRVVQLTQSSVTNDVHRGRQLITSFYLLSFRWQYWNCAYHGTAQ